MNTKTVVSIALFGALWLSPLLLPTGLYRYALEEIRVLAVGILLGYLIRKGGEQ